MPSSTPTDPVLPLVAALERRARFGVFVLETARLGMLAGFLLGGLLLALRLFFELEPAAVAPSLWGLAAAPVIAAARALRSDWSAAEASAWLDARLGGSGTVVTALERPDPRWRTNVETHLARPFEMPRLALGREVWGLLLATLFVTAATWLELPRIETKPPRSLFDVALNRLSGNLAFLDKNFALGEETASELQQRLEQLRAHAEDGSPESVFEAIDRLGSDFEKHAAGLAETAERVGADLLGAAADPGLKGQALRAAMKAALSRMDQAGLGQELPQELQGLFPEGLKLPEGLDLSDLDLLEMSDSMRVLLNSKLGALAQSGLLDQEHLARALQLAAPRLGELGMPFEEGELMDFRKGIERMLGGMGGVAHGPGSAELVWGEETPERQAEFEVKTLAGARYADPSHTGRLGEDLTLPELMEQGESAGLVDVEASGGGSAWRRRLAPRHRRVVREFFSREGEASEEEDG